MTTMYHGTSIDSARDILRRGFDLKRAGARQKALRGEDVAEVPGIYLTTDKRQARWYAGDDMSSPGLNKGGAVVEVKVVGKLMTDSQWWKLRGAVAKELGDTSMYPDYKTRMATLAEAIKRAVRQGYVGFHEHQDEYVIFDPKAIKVTGAFEADTEYKLASHVAARWLTAASVSRRDMEDALDHMSDLAGRTLSLDEFSASPVKNKSMRELYSYDDIDAWAEWEDGELADLSEAELEEELSAFRGRMFARRALRWVKNGTVPPIVVVDSEDAVGIGDGRGRVTVDLGMGWDTVPAVVLQDSPQGKTAVRKLFWHGTATKNLRSILSQGLVPRGKLVFDEDIGAAGQRSIKTFGGIYMTDNFMTAWSAASTATYTAAGVKGGPVKSKVMVGINYETRSPNTLADEDDLMPLIERVAGRTYDDLQNYRSMWAPLWPHKSRSTREGAFNPNYLHQVAEVVERADLSAGVAKVLENVFGTWEKAERGYKARKQRVDAAIERLLRAHVAHLIENEIVSNRARRIKHIQENLERLPTDPWYEKNPEKLSAARERHKDTLNAIRNPPKLFTNTFPRMAAAAEEVSRLIPEMTGEASGWSMRHNVRTLDPIGYRGKNRIIMVVEHREPQDNQPYKDLIFHVGAQHYKAFTKEYEKYMGYSYRVLDRSGKVLDWSLNPRDEWPEDLWGPAPRAVAASRTARKPPLDEKRRNFNEPTKPDLWEKVLELARGDKRDMKYRGKEIQGPNRGKGFDEYPSSYANGWAVRIYNLLGGKWRRVPSGKAGKNKRQEPTMAPAFKGEKKEATKTRSEKETEAAEALVRPAPKKKPPRMDLRRHKVDPDYDKDLDDGDKDLSLNYKDIGASLNKVSARIVASRWVEAIAMKSPKDDNKAESIPEAVKEQALKEHRRNKEEHPESDMTLKDWVKRVMERREVKPKKPGEKETGEKKKLREEAEAEKAEKSQQKERLQRAENAIDLATLEMLEETSLPYDFREKMKSSLEGLDDQETLQVVEGFENRLKELASNPPSVEDAVTLATEMRGVGGDPDQVGQELAEALYATRVVLNPLNLGGKPISGEKKTSEQLKDRAVEARKHYERLDTEHRASAVRDLIRHRDALDPGSPEHAETVAILRGVGLAAAKNGEEIRGLPSPSSKYTLLVRALSNHGKEDMLLGSVDDFSSPEAQQAMKDAVQDLTIAELRHLAGDDKVLAPLIDALESGDLPEDRKEMLKHMVATITVGEMAMLDPLVGEALKAKGKPASPKERAEAMKARREERKGRGLPSMLGGPLEALSDPAALLNNLRKGEGLSSLDPDVRGGEKEWITPGGDLDKMTAAIMRDRYEDIASTIGIPEDSKIAPIFEAASEKGWSYVSQGRFEPTPSQPLPLETDDEGKLKKAGYELTPWTSF